MFQWEVQEVYSINHKFNEELCKCQNDCSVTLQIYPLSIQTISIYVAGQFCLCNLMLLIPPGFFRMQTFSIWVNFTLRISPKPHYIFFQGSAPLNARCDDKRKICNIVSQNFKAVGSVGKWKQNRDKNRSYYPWIWHYTGKFLAAWPYYSYCSCQFFSDNEEGWYCVNNRTKLSDMQLSQRGKKTEERHETGIRGQKPWLKRKARRGQGCSTGEKEIE